MSTAHHKQKCLPFTKPATKKIRFKCLQCNLIWCSLKYHLIDISWSTNANFGTQDRQVFCSFPHVRITKK